MTDACGTTSLWMEHAMPSFAPLAQNARCDVCVVGAGIAGMTTAYMLAKSGVSVIVVDRVGVGGGQTSRTTAHLSFALDDRYSELERVHGKRGARLAADSHRAAVDMIESIVAEQGIACELERLDGYLILAPGASVDLLEAELEAARDAGVDDVTLVPRAPLPRGDSGPCLRFGAQGQFHPTKFLSALAREIERSSGRIYTETHVAEVQGGTPCRVQTRSGAEITCDAVVVATNTPFNDRVTMHTKQAAYRTYAIALNMPERSVERALFWDTADPYHYVRCASFGDGREVLIVGGEDHKTGQADDTDARFERLEQWTRQLFPAVQDVVHRWSGQVLEPVDGLAFIGRNPHDSSNVYIATGDSGHGMTHGVIAGRLISDLIQGRPNPWAELYDPSRTSLKSVGELAHENLNVARQYGDWLRGSDVESIERIAPGTGAVIRDGVHKLAIYRDDAGATHACSAVCPHLGCVVHWNGTERSWDCPCHGSRFDAYGELLEGPANRGLTPHAPDSR